MTSIVRTVAAVRILVTALASALAAAACLVLVHTWNPVVSFELLRDFPPIATGFYPVERLGHDAWVWTAERAEIVLDGLDRRVPWSCTVTFRGSRADPASQPELEAAVDGVRVAARRATNDFQDLEVTAPVTSGRTGLALALRSSTTMVPGGGDPRTLGVQVNRLDCRAVGAGLVRPPTSALWHAALSAGALGAAFGAASATAGGALAATLVAAGLLAVALAAGTALFGPFSRQVAWFAIASSALAVAVLIAARLRRPSGWSAPARFVVAFSAAAWLLKLAALTHPSKPLVDAVFHAHRFEGVLAGRFYFTQLSTSATPFPYAIGLYLFAAPWAILADDHVTLLRVVVLAADALASALLYVLVVRTWNDRLAGALAAVLSSLLPLWYLIVGSANLTNAFGQSVATVTVIAAVVWAERRGAVLRVAGLTALATLGLLCHVSTLALLFTTLVGLAVLFWWKGGPHLRPAARDVAIAALSAAALATALYWGHFGSLYAARLEQVRAGIASRLQASDTTGVSDVRGPSGVARTTGDSAPTTARSDDAKPRAAAGAASPAIGREFVPLPRRITGAMGLIVSQLGWPILTLAAVGTWRVWRSRERGRPAGALPLALVAMGTTCGVFLTLAILSAVDRRYQQDAWEFIGRVELLSYPAAVILAARGAAWGWRAGFTARMATALLVAAAAVVGARAWLGWLGLAE